MRSLWITLAGLLAAVLLFLGGIQLLAQASAPAEKPGNIPFLTDNETLVTVNTTRIGSDDPIETAVAVAQIVYPVTEEENSPGAVVLVNLNSLAEVLVAASRVQHFPVNAPLLYVNGEGIPQLTRAELLRLKPEGVPMDGNVQVYLVGTIGPEVQQQVEQLGFQTRVFTAPDPAALAEKVDDWTSTQHGDHRNEIAIANLDNLEPAIPSAFWNAHRGDGLVFVTNDGIPEATRRILERRADGPWLYLFGDESVVSAEIAGELSQFGHVTRINAGDIAGTSAYFAGFHDEGSDWGAWLWQANRSFGWGISEAGHNAIFVNTAGPGGWQNALPATTLSHMGKHAPVLAVTGEGIPDPVRRYLEVTQPYPTAPRQQLLNHGWIIGGRQTISWETQTELDLLLEGYLPAAQQEGS